ncbi:CAP domain-containing protein [Streptomyces sp. NPDC085481]|uniref:CAP domain-containing protein n=1 Tax=Streptomyces sp. NPDC085481 TaxID=3365727 RepID=UPI0037D29F4F
MQHDAYDAGVPVEGPGPEGHKHDGFAHDGLAHGGPEHDGFEHDAAGRHRRSGGRRWRPRWAPSFRTAVTTAGAVAAALTVTTGVYVATLGTPADAGTRSDRAAASPAPVPPPPTKPTDPAATEATAAADPAAAAPATTGTGHAAGSTPATRTGAAPATRADLTSAPEVRPSRTPARRTVAGRPAPPGEESAFEEVSAVVGTVSQFVQQVVGLANTEREKAGCAPLRSDARLREAAQRHADDMARRDYYAHTNPEGHNAGDRITAAGYPWATWGENIHRGPETPTQAIEDWMNSEGHRKNILNCSFKDIGVGVTLTGNGPWWVQDFATSR